MKVTLILPTINEIEGMKAVLPRIKREWVDEIIVVDGGSTDGTCEYAKENGCIVVIQRTPFLYGAYQDALQAASGDIVVTFSPDGNSIPELIPPLIEKMKEGYDMVIVSRYAQGAGSEDDDWLTGVGNWLFTRMINVCFGGKYTDSLVIFRAWKKSVIKLCRWNSGIGGVDPQLSIVCAKHRLKVGEIPGNEPKRIGGVRKMDPIKNGWGLVRLITKEFFEYPRIDKSVLMAGGEKN